MKLVLPGDTSPVYIVGEVAWTNENLKKRDFEYMAGVKFSKIDNYDKFRLLDYVYNEWLKTSKN